MHFVLPAVGVIFDLEVLRGKIMDALTLFGKCADPMQLVGCMLASGDVLRPQSEIVRSRFDYCVAVSGHEHATQYIRGTFGDLEVPGLAPKYRRIVEQPILDQLGLTMDGCVDLQGRMVTEEWDRDAHFRCRSSSWGYAPEAVNYRLPPELSAELEVLRRVRR